MPAPRVPLADPVPRSPDTAGAHRRPDHPKPGPERRRRIDLVAAAVIVVLLAGATWWVGSTSDVAGTVSQVAAAPITAPPPAAGIPAGLVEAWRAPSAATPTPVVSGPAVVTADGQTVVGHDPLTGAEAWSYSRDLPLCTVGSAFPAFEVGRVLALYGNGDAAAGTGDGEYCSELTALRADNGERATARNPDTRRGTRFLADPTYVLATGTDHLEVLRSDLVRTLEYGAVPAQEQAGRQPRPGCSYGSATLAAHRVAVVERCPEETADRLTVIDADVSDKAEEPQVKFSILLPGRNATVVALTENRVAVALPAPARLIILDGAGTQLGITELDLPADDLATDPPGGIAATSADADHRYWWTGSAVVALDSTELAPLWTLPGTLGPPVPYGGGLLVPVPGGLQELDARSGTVGRLLPVERDDPNGPVAVAAQGEVLLEQRGPELVALLPQ